jgi:phospholipase/carboxylesterase
MSFALPGRMVHRPPAAETGRIRVPPPQGQGQPPAGITTLLRRDNRGGVLATPEHPVSGPYPVLLMLHGAGGNGANALSLVSPLAEERGFLVVAPDSAGTTWDRLHGGFGVDTAYIQSLLGEIWSTYTINPVRVAIGGFSDGASYALSLGLTNGDLFSHVVAFSPGFMAPAALNGSPSIFVSHGTHDAVLPIDRCSRRIIPALRDAGYNVTYREFEGPHTVPRPIVREALDWVLSTPSPSKEEADRGRAGR